jgi:hypothetical protein
MNAGRGHLRDYKSHVLSYVRLAVHITEHYYIQYNSILRLSMHNLFICLSFAREIEIEDETAQCRANWHKCQKKSESVNVLIYVI